MRNNREKIELAHRMRGEVISWALDVEDALTYALGYLYSPLDGSDVVHEFLSAKMADDLIADMAFERKIQLLEKAFEREDYNAANRKLTIKTLNHIRTVRNQFAHRPFSAWRYESEFSNIINPDDEPADTVTFHKSGREDLRFSESELSEYKALCESYAKGLMIICDEILKDRAKRLEGREKET